MTYTDDDLTPWFPPDVKPVHEGVYEIKSDTSIRMNGYSQWDGKQWGPSYDMIGSCFNMAAVDIGVPGVWAVGKKWRGLKKQP